MTNYEIITSFLGSEIIKRTDENGAEWFIPKDESNSDYQRYLRWLENPEAEQSTPSVPTDGYLTPPAIMESPQPDEADLTEGNN
jgi:hypothetical protein